VEKRKLPKVMLIALIIAGVAIPLSGCTSSSDVVSAENQVVAVEWGDITIDRGRWRRFWWRWEIR